MKLQDRLYEQLPAHMRGAMQLWVENGLCPGGFLTAVLENDLMEAFGRADMENRKSMFQYCMFLYNDAPRESHGSPEKVKAWAERGGLIGKTGKADPESPR